MESFLKIFISLTLCLAMSECSVLDRFRRYYEEDESCWQAMRNCSRRLGEHYRTTFDSFEGTKAFFSDRAQLAQLCTDLRDAQKCFTGVLSSHGCSSDYLDNSMFDYEVTTGYICKEQSQRLIQAATQSPCLESEETAIATVMAAGTCASRLEDALKSEEAPAVCPALFDMRQCIVDGAQQRCGPEMHALVSDLAAYVVEEPNLLERFWSESRIPVPADFACLRTQTEVQTPARRSLNIFSPFKFLH